MRTKRLSDGRAGLILFGLLAIGGLLQVKWLPYWHKAGLASASHSIGASILTGGAVDPPPPSLDAALSYAWAYGAAVWQAMVLGLVLGSAVQAIVPARLVLRWLGRANMGGVLTGAILSVPGMMCSCCAAPVIVGLRRAGASAGAAVAFWLGNATLNPATLIFMGFVIGWRWAALRLVLGLAMVLGLGLIANRIGSATGGKVVDGRHPAGMVEPPAGNALRRWLSILGGMTVRLVPEYIVLVLLLGAGRAWLFPYAGPEVGDGIGWILAFAVAGTLFVIPTAGEVPIVQAMLALGIGAGPAGALLMTLAPISVPSVAMLWGVLGRRLLLALMAGVVVAGMIGGGAAVLLRF